MLSGNGDCHLEMVVLVETNYMACRHEKIQVYFENVFSSRITRLLIRSHGGGAESNAHFEDGRSIESAFYPIRKRASIDSTTDTKKDETMR